MTTQTPAIRRAVRRGNQLKRARIELRKLDDKDLIKRLAKYLGRTPTEAKREIQRGWFSRGLIASERDMTIEAIIRYELPE